jgi:hypothetical protein
MDRAKTRKPHKKSRNGCLPCKGRHVKVRFYIGQSRLHTLTIMKCDEQKPNCANCVKQGTSCDYRPSQSREVSNTSPPVFTPSSTEGACTFVDQQPLPEYGLVPTNGVSEPDLTLNIPQMRLLQYVEAALLHYLGVSSFICPYVIRPPKSPELFQDLLGRSRIAN